MTIVYAFIGMILPMIGFLLVSKLFEEELS